MPIRRTPLLARCAALTLLLVAATSCGEAKKYDWKNRDVAWKFGPLQGGATFEHRQGAGKNGGKALAEGWKLGLVEGNRLTVKAYKLNKSHSLLGKVLVRVGLYDKQSKNLVIVDSETVTVDNASFSFDVSEDVAKKTWDAIVWFAKV